MKMDTVGNIDYEIKTQKAIQQETECRFIRIDPGKEDFDIFRIINEIFRYIKQLTEKTPINNISTKLLELELKKNTANKNSSFRKSKQNRLMLLCYLW